MRRLVVLAATTLWLTLLAPPGAQAADCVVSPAGQVTCGTSFARTARSYNYVLVARLFERTGYTGRVLRIYRTRPCSTSTSTVEMSLDLTRVNYYGRWDDRVMSFTTHNNCDARLFDGPDGGVTMFPTGWLDRDADMLINGRNWQRKVDVIRLS